MSSEHEEDNIMESAEQGQGGLATAASVFGLGSASADPSSVSAGKASAHVPKTRGRQLLGSPAIPASITSQREDRRSHSRSRERERLEVARVAAVEAESRGATSSIVPTCVTSSPPGLSENSDSNAIHSIVLKSLGAHFDEHVRTSVRQLTTELNAKKDQVHPGQSFHRKAYCIHRCLESRHYSQG